MYTHCNIYMATYTCLYIGPWISHLSELGLFCLGLEKVARIIRFWWLCSNSLSLMKMAAYSIVIETFGKYNLFSETYWWCCMMENDNHTGWCIFVYFFFQVLTLGVLKKAVVDECPSTFDDCIQWACNLFHDYYYCKISQLLHVFPPNHKTTTGQMFWSGPKRCPKPIRFNVNEVCDVH